MESTTIAVDLAKSVFQVAVSHRAGHVSVERRLPRRSFLPFFAQQPPATVLLEACGSAHHWARQLQQCGHAVRLLPPHDVHRYARRDTTDRGDAKALLEAARNDEIRAVPVKTVDQQMIASLHRVRSTWLTTRTARLNTVRGLLREFGLVISVGAHHVVPTIHTLTDDDRVPATLRPALVTLAEEIRTLEATVHGIDQQLATLARQSPEAALLQTVPGVGVITATALLAAVGEMRRFPTGRHFASFLGLTAKETSSGEHRRLGAISRRGDTYLRMLLIHGGRSVLWSAKGNDGDGWPACLGPPHRATAGAQRRRRRGGQQARAHRVGGVASPAALHGRCAGLNGPAHDLTGGSPRCAGTPVGPARGETDDLRGLRGRSKRLVPRARMLCWPGAPPLLLSGRRYDCGPHARAARRLRRTREGDKVGNAIDLATCLTEESRYAG